MKRVIFTTVASVVLAAAAAPAFAQDGHHGGRHGGRGDHHGGPGGHGGMMMLMLQAADADDDKSVTRAEVDELRGEMFDWMDRNGDGVLDDADRSPIHQRLAAKGGAPDAGMRHGRGGHHAELDENDDGALDRAEFLNGASPIFEALDADADGVITPDELDAAAEERRRMKPWWRDDD